MGGRLVGATRETALELRIAVTDVHGALVARDIARAAIVVGAATSFIVISDIWLDHAVEGWAHWLSAVGLICASVLSFQLSRLWLIWRERSIARAKLAVSRNRLEKRTMDRGFLELFIYLISALVSLAATAFASTQPGWFGENKIHIVQSSAVGPDPQHVAVFLSIFGLAFIPLLFAFFIEARRECRDRGLRLFRNDGISPLTVLIASALAAGVALLAWAAAGKMFSMTENFGVIITLIVICGFLSIIVLPHVARFWNDRSEAREAALAGAHAAAMPLTIPAGAVSRIDSALVRLVAPLSGATQKGPGVPHALLIAIMLPLSALGYVLASPFGLIPIGVAMIIALALGRRWAWLEEDRETASRLQSTVSNELHIGFDNDLKDEALLGYATLFLLVPLALNQLQEWTQSFHVVEGATSGNAFVDWLRFFGAELAKAVPFVDWWEVYDVEVGTPFDAHNADPLAKHLTFTARALVDLVIMSALVQALGMWHRNRTQHRLYDSGQLDFFDPFTEAAFFETGMQSHGAENPRPKDRFIRRIEAHVASKKALGLPAIPYSERRLSELIRAENKDVQAGADWMIKTYGILAGSPREQLAQLRQRWFQLRLPQLVAAGTPESKIKIRHEKLDFERVVSSLAQNLTSVEDAEIGILLGLLEEVKGSPEFGYGQVQTYELFGQLHSQFSVFALALHVLDDRHYIARPVWREQMTAEMGFRLPPLFLQQAEPRMRVYDALRQLGTNPLANTNARRNALELLQWMGSSEPDEAGRPSGDRATIPQKRALECAQAVAESLAAKA